MYIISGSSSEVERLLPKQKVVGSNPISRSMKLKNRLVAKNVVFVATFLYNLVTAPVRMEAVPKLTNGIKRRYSE